MLKNTIFMLKFDDYEMNNLNKYEEYFIKNLASERIVDKIKKKKHVKDIKFSIYSDLIVKYIMLINNVDEEIIFNRYGKPYLSNNPLYFNISYSSEVLVCAVSRKEVGVDIEYIDYEKGKTFMDLQIKNCDDEMFLKIVDNYFEKWCIVESFLKKIGIGLTYGLDWFTITKKEHYIIKLNSCKTIEYVRTQKIWEEYYLALCSDSNEKFVLLQLDTKVLLKTIVNY